MAQELRRTQPSEQSAAGNHIEQRSPLQAPTGSPDSKQAGGSLPPPSLPAVQRGVSSNGAAGQAVGAATCLTDELDGSRSTTRSEATDPCAPSVPAATIRPGQHVIDDASSNGSKIDGGGFPDFPPELVAKVAEQVAEQVMRKLNITGASPPQGAPTGSTQVGPPHASAAPPTTTSPARPVKESGNLAPPRAPPATSAPSVAHPPGTAASTIATPSNAAPSDTSVRKPQAESHKPPSPRPQPDFVFYGAAREPSSPRPVAGADGAGDTAKVEATVNRSGEGQSSSRSKARQATAEEETPLDRTWGQLFAEDGKSTTRLRQFLRGLANHIIEDFEPKKSIVVTPSKMAKFYETCKLRMEFWPWRTLFVELSSSKLSRVYQELECQHHFVQDRNDSKPCIPGLTAVGFARWVTLLIRARPDEEVERLQQAVLQMPISNADDQKERFPKEISRRLFPKEADHRVHDRIERAMPVREGRSPSRTTEGDHGREATRDRDRPSYSYATKDTAEVPHPRGPPGPAPPPSHKTDWDRATQVSSSEAVSDGPSPPPPPGSLERERKPYTAQPGGGKSYEAEAKAASAAPARSNSSATRPRRNSINSRPRDFPPTRDFQIPAPDGNQHGRAGSVTNAPPRRRRSPSISHGAAPSTRSETDIPSQGESSTPIEIGVDNRRYPRPPEMAQADWTRQGQSPSHRYPIPSDREAYERGGEGNGGRRGHDEDYYRVNNRPAGNGYDPKQPYPPVYH